MSFFLTYYRWVIDLCEIDIYASFVCWIGWLPTDIGENSQPEVYAACLLRKSQNTNKVVICQIQRRFICKHVMQRQEINISLPCSCKVGEKWLCSHTYSGITRNWSARLGLLYLFIVGGQCHTGPLMHVPGVLGCCAPVVGRYMKSRTMSCMRNCGDNSINKDEQLVYAMRTVHFVMTTPNIIPWRDDLRLMHPSPKEDHSSFVTSLVMG